MNPILDWLSGGDLRSDGMANEVAAVVLKNQELFGEVYAGLGEDDDVIRGRTADALEKISRSKPELLKDRLPQILQRAEEDPVPMVRIHLAMMLGHLAICEELIEDLTLALLSMLADSSVFAKSWAIVSLCIIARKYPKKRDQILRNISRFQQDGSIAIRTKVRYAIDVLTDEAKPFPKGWIKSEHLREI